MINDFNDRRNCFPSLTKEFEADRAAVARHAMHDPARRGDQAIAAFFLNSRQAA